MALRCSYRGSGSRFAPFSWFAVCLSLAESPKLTAESFSLTQIARVYTDFIVEAFIEGTGVLGLFSTAFDASSKGV